MGNTNCTGVSVLAVDPYSRHIIPLLDESIPLKGKSARVALIANEIKVASIHS